MELDEITLVLLEEKLGSEDPGILTPYYTDDAPFDDSERRSAQLLNLLIEKGLKRGYFTNITKPLFIADTSGKRKMLGGSFLQRA